jgi:hypothetical protein
MANWADLLGAYPSPEENLNAPFCFTNVDEEGVNTTRCCIGRTYNKTLLHRLIFMSPESTLKMEGFDGKSRFEATGKVL